MNFLDFLRRCWGCGLLLAHHRDCPACMPSPNRYVFPILNVNTGKPISGE